MNWLDSPAYDAWKTTPPEPKESKLQCSECDLALYPDDVCYEIDGDIFCEDCANEWLNCQKLLVTEDMCDE